MTTYYRTGRHVGRTIYRQVSDRPSDRDELVGMMDTPELAAQVVDALNRSLRSDQVAARTVAACEHRTLVADFPSGFAPVTPSCGCLP